MFKKLLLVLLFSLAPTAAYAVGPNLNHCLFTWTVPPFPGNDLAATNVYVGTVSGGPYLKVGTVAATSPAGNQVYSPATNFCTGLSDSQKYAIVRTQNLAGTESGASNEVPFVLDAAVPPSVTDLGVH